ncbi:HAUS augmin-like complex subunit 1, variant 2 [Entomophthora muscae]|uniref:HAUS augmin-like complex subunit 1, variant 2 n=1 Tax=Entomophthora muscae TaxID=34485 RepID=A0ACC2TEX4_9FUNG|nr:HAUS augmin-like complex subunit 1, variant 2 [Entomophthora muscae]
MDEKPLGQSQGSLLNISLLSNDISKENVSFDWFNELVPDEEQDGNQSGILNMFNNLSPDSSSLFHTSYRMEKNKLFIDKVYPWLIEMFGEVPPFEDEPEAVEHLVSVYKHYKWINESQESLQYSSNLQATEYELEGNRLKKELEASGVIIESLSSATLECLDELSSTAIFLGSKDTQKPSLQISLLDYQEEMFNLKDQISKFERGISRLKKQTFQRQEDNSALKRTLQNIIEQMSSISQKTTQRNGEVNILAVKAEEYRESVSMLEKNWSSGPVETEHLRYEELLALKKEIEENEKVFNSIQPELQSYNDLPLDLVHAKMEITKAKNELVGLLKFLSDILGLSS